MELLIVIAGLVICLIPGMIRESKERKEAEARRFREYSAASDKAYLERCPWQTATVVTDWEPPTKPRQSLEDIVGKIIAVVLFLAVCVGFALFCWPLAVGALVCTCLGPFDFSAKCERNRDDWNGYN